MCGFCMILLRDRFKAQWIQALNSTAEGPHFLECFMCFSQRLFASRMHHAVPMHAGMVLWLV